MEPALYRRLTKIRLSGVLNLLSAIALRYHHDIENLESVIQPGVCPICEKKETSSCTGEAAEVRWYLEYSTTGPCFSSLQQDDVTASYQPLPMVQEAVEMNPGSSMRIQYQSVLFQTHMQGEIKSCFSECDGPIARNAGRKRDTR